MFQLSVSFIEQLGADTVVHGAVAGTAAPLVVRLAGVQRQQAGAVMPLRCAAEDLHLFDAETGQRLGSGA